MSYIVENEENKIISNTLIDGGTEGSE